MFFYNKLKPIPLYSVVITVFFLCLFWPFPAQAIETNYALVQALDKVTARVSTIKLQKDKATKFGRLEIILRRCDRTPPTEQPESTAYLEIYDSADFNENKTVDDKAKDMLVFSNWMFASAPAVNPFEHPVYDIWVKECVKE